MSSSSKADDWSKSKVDEWLADLKSQREDLIEEVQQNRRELTKSRASKNEILSEYIREERRLENLCESLQERIRQNEVQQNSLKGEVRDLAISQRLNEAKQEGTEISLKMAIERCQEEIRELTMSHKHNEAKQAATERSLEREIERCREEIREQGERSVLYKETEMQQRDQQERCMKMAEHHQTKMILEMVMGDQREQRNTMNALVQHFHQLNANTMAMIINMATKSSSATGADSPSDRPSVIPAPWYDAKPSGSLDDTPD